LLQAEGYGGVETLTARAFNESTEQVAYQAVIQAVFFRELFDCFTLSDKTYA
jgi:hypothetical protein